MAAPISPRVRRRKALVAALALNRGEVDPRRLAHVLGECARTVRPPADSGASGQPRRRTRGRSPHVLKTTPQAVS